MEEHLRLVHREDGVNVRDAATDGRTQLPATAWNICNSVVSAIGQLPVQGPGLEVGKNLERIVLELGRLRRVLPSELLVLLSVPLWGAFLVLSVGPFPLLFGFLLEVCLAGQLACCISPLRDRWRRVLSWTSGSQDVVSSLAALAPSKKSCFHLLGPLENLGPT